jgi:gas vesicle protein
MRKALAFTFGAILGGILGGVTAMLLAPTSGKELRSSFKKQVEQIQIEIKDAAQKKREELEQQLEDLKHPEQS